MKKFELNNFNLSLLQGKSKLFTYVSSKLDKAYFKLSNNSLIFALCGNDGVLATSLKIDYEGDTQYFCVDFSKWFIALQKFSGVDVLKMSLNKSLLTLSVDGSLDTINLGVINYEEGSIVAKQINDFIKDKKSEILACNHKITLTPEIISNFDLMNNLFTTQNRVNSIGISKSDIMYADRSLVIKANLEEELNSDLFSDTPTDDNHIYLHSFTLKLIDILKDFNKDISFDKEFDVLYWADDNTEIVIYSDSKNFSLPTDEQFEGIQPQNKNTTFEVDVNTLDESFNFFNGLYEGSAWKPLKFVLSKGKDIVLYYKSPTTEANKTLIDIKSDFDGEFTIESETMKKILQKVKERFSSNKLNVLFNFDDASVKEPSPGIYCTIKSPDNSKVAYEFIISTLLDE